MAENLAFVDDTVSLRFTFAAAQGQALFVVRVGEVVEVVLRLWLELSEHSQPGDLLEIENKF